MKFYFDTACLPQNGNNSLVASKPGLSAIVNKTVGMPVPADAYRYYHEYIVPAGQPMTIHARIASETRMGNKVYTHTTTPGVITFVPQPEHDYEMISVETDGRTEINLRRLVATNNHVSTEPIQVERASACPKSN